MRSYKWIYDVTYPFGCNFVITDNTVIHNAELYTYTAEIVIDTIPDSTYAGQVPVGVITGNDCSLLGNIGPPGRIMVNHSDGTTRVNWIGTYVMSDLPPAPVRRAVDSGLRFAGAGGPRVQAQRDEDNAGCVQGESVAWAGRGEACR